jgi:two-component system sensor histidine kinase/response regulator
MNSPWPFARHEPKPQRAEPRQLPPSVAPEVVDLDLMIDRLGGDESLAAEVIGLFMTDCPRRLEAIRTAIDRQDVDQLRVAAHTLKGLAGNVAAGRLIEASRILEQIGTDGLISESKAAWLHLSAEAALVVELLQQVRTSAERGRA